MGRFFTFDTDNIGKISLIFFSKMLNREQNFYRYQ